MDKSNKGLLTILGDGTSFEGSITVPHSIRIDGYFKGRIDTSEVLTIGSTGVVEADIIARSAVVGGKVVGNMTVHDRVELDANASLIGDLSTKDLIISEGAVFHGKCTMDTEKEDII